MQLIRKTLAEVKAMDLTRDEMIVDEINDYFERRSDHAKIREKIKSRFGVGITTETDPANPDAPYKLYSRKDFTVQVDAGLIEAISIGWGQKIINALATLFTERGQRYELISEVSDDTSAEIEYLESIRDNGNYDSEIVEADRKAIACGASAIFVQAKNEGLSYQCLSPSDIRIYWPNKIIDGDVERAPDMTDIEDAYAVVLRLSEIDHAQYNYLAIYGRSEDFPNGRWVEYVSNTNETALPRVGDDKTREYTINGEIANPLSYFANQKEASEIAVPDYPIAIIRGVSDDKSRPMPVYTSLYEDDIEFAITASHILSKANSAASGTNVISQAHDGVGQPLPRTMDGYVTLLPGQSYEYVSKDAGSVMTAWETVEKLQVNAAEGWGVPDYMVVSEDHTLDASSGVALQVKTRPLKKIRELREKKNSRSVSKIFDIEKALLNLHYDTPESKPLLQCVMRWTAGALEMPENKKEKADRIIALGEKGILDIIAQIREYYDFSSDDEAVEMYNTMKDRKTEFPPLIEQQQKNPAVGSAFRNRQQQQQNNNA